MRTAGRARRCRRASALLAALGLVLSGCAQATSGSGTIGPAHLAVQGDSGGTFDTDVKDAISDVIGFWTVTYPKITGGKKLPPLKGKLYSVDGDAIVADHHAPASVKDNKCLQQRLSFIVDNAAYCQLDDSIVWDRSPAHIIPVLTRAYGRDLTALVFAHEFGHAIQQRLGIIDRHLPTIDIESQADCAAGAFAAAALHGLAPHFQFSSADLDRALDGYLQIRDSTPDASTDVSHGDGFDRLNALQQGIQNGAGYCYGNSFLQHRTFTERPYVNDSDYLDNGNEPMSDLLSSKGITADLNRFWKRVAASLHKTLKPVQLKAAAHPACAGSTPLSEFGYCPDDNTVYYSPDFARRAYYSITTPRINPQTAAVTLQHNQPGDYALGFLISVAWGLAARHQFFHGSLADRPALLAGICYGGAYAEDINRANGDATHPYILSPPDMDEATSALINLVGLDQAFGTRGTTALQRVQTFVTGYTRGRNGC